MGSFSFVMLAYLAIIISIFNVIKKAQTGGKSGRRQPEQRVSAPAPRVLKNQGKKEASSDHVHSDSDLGPQQSSKIHARFNETGFVMEDRKNDWLARQRREESRIAARSELDLGALHNRECSSHTLQQESIELAAAEAAARLRQNKHK